MIRNTEDREIVISNHSLILRPDGEMGSLSRARVDFDSARIIRLMVEKRIRHVIVDLHQANHIGMATIGQLITIGKHVNAVDGRMVLCRVPRFVSEILRLMRLNQIWPQCLTVDESIQYVMGDTRKILIVDDNLVQRNFVAALLKKIPTWEICFAGDGVEALEIIEQSTPDLVVTDLVMPNLDGLELLTAIRECYSRLPVILMTAYGNESIAAEALERGAVSYISKSQQAFRLADTVRRVLACSAAARQTQINVHDCTARIDGTFWLDNDPDQITRLVALIQQMLSSVSIVDPMEQIRTGVAIEEALINALYHGNLEISSSQWRDAYLSPGKLEALFRQKLAQAELQKRKITIDVSITTHSARFVIRDEGMGFDQSGILKRDLQATFDLGCYRGSMLMSKLMDRVSYNESGNEITLIKFPTVAA